jgi:hypothetical protein
MNVASMEFGEGVTMVGSGSNCKDTKRKNGGI